MFKKICRLLIIGYKKGLSPLVGKGCIYTPTCSMYTLDAIQKYGVIRGCFMGARRILRCNPFRRGGFDPVRENLKGVAKWTL